MLCNTILYHSMLHNILLFHTILHYYIFEGGRLWDCEEHLLGIVPFHFLSSRIK